MKSLITMKDIIKNGAYDALKKVVLHRGLNDIESEIYTLLVLSKTKMSAREIAESTGYAYSSVVNALNNLRRRYLVDRNKRTRCYEYGANADFVGMLRRERRQLIEYLTEARNALKDKKDYKDLVEHIDECINYLGKVEKEVE